MASFQRGRDAIGAKSGRAFPRPAERGGGGPPAPPPPPPPRLAREARSAPSPRCAGRNDVGVPELSVKMPEQLSARCCIVGGGPAGMMLGLLLARAGIDVVVLEKHADFLRDFRGDTIHPSTLELMHEVGLLEAFLELPHQEVRVLKSWFGDTELTLADFTHLPTHCRFIALMPQWDFLDLLAREAGRHPAFRLLMHTEATTVMEAAGRIVGVHAKTPQGALELRADLVIGADGLHSSVRRVAGLAVEELGAQL